MLQYIDWDRASTIIELGGGKGSMTRAIIKKKNDRTIFTTCEIQKARYQELMGLQNHHTRVLHMDAERCLKELSPNTVNSIISTLPLGSMSPVHAREILEAASKSLSKDGVFVQYQYFATNKDDIEKYFHIIDTDWELLNLPPAFIYICKKR